MPSDRIDQLRRIRTFPSLVRFLRDEMDWPISSEDFEELTFDYTPEELGIDTASAAKIQEIKRMRPLSANQPWGIFFVKFEPKKLPVVALRRILSRVVLKKRASANSAERAAWRAEDLLFVSNYGEGEERRICFAHFSQDGRKNDLPTLKVLGWDNLDTPLHLDHVADVLCERLSWPDKEEDAESWRETWRSAFTLRHREVITTSRDLAVRLAALARAIRDRIHTVLAIETEKGPVTKLMKAFQEALIHDLDADGFADMYAQTIAYGLLSARVENPQAHTADDFAAELPVTNPFLKDLLETFLSVEGRKGRAGDEAGIDFDELGVSEVVELLDDANMEAVVRDFGDRNPQEDPVIHFYELFLKEYDAKKRMLRGVFYTPRPVVSFIVRSVDELLRTEFGLKDGLADTTTWGEMAERLEGLEIPDGVRPDAPFVQILDPATGTGTFLVEVIDIVHRTMMEKWKAEGHGPKKIEQLWNDYVPKHLLPRLHGYELLMAPYAIAHMKIGLKLYETGYRFGSDERARVFLTNTLEPPKDFSDRLAFAIPALAHEAEAVNEIKRCQRFTVIVGNPPYAKSQTENTWILDLMSRYREGLQEKKSDIGREEWKFMRYATHQIDASLVGVVAYIINNSFLDAPTLRQMRGNLLEQFGQIAILNLHGDANKGEVTPEGAPDWNVFDIKQGVCVVALSRKPSCTLGRWATCRYGDLWGCQEDKYEALLRGVVSDRCARPLVPDKRWKMFIPRDRTVDDEYFSAASISDNWLFVCGIETKRDHFAIDMDREALQERIREFADCDLSEDDLKARFDVRDNDWVVLDAKRLLARDESWLGAIVPCVYRPFDFRWVLYLDYVLARDRGPLIAGMIRPNIGLVVPRQTKEDFGALAISTVCTHKIVSVYDRSFLFPLYAYPESSLGTTGRRVCNINRGFLQGLADSLGVPLLDEGRAESLAIALGPEDVFDYVYAQFYSPLFRERYGAILKIDFPRMFRVKRKELFYALAEFGNELVALHLMESPKLDEYITTLVGSGKFRVEKVSYWDGTVWIDKAKTRGFRGVPEEVWNFHIGGYQVCEKWLKDRGPKKGKPGRLLTKDDLTHYQKIVVALNETIHLMAEIDEVIEAHGGWPGAFVTDNTASKKL